LYGAKIYAVYKDILDAIEKIEEFVEDDKTSSAVTRKLEIIGEATKNIPVDIRKKYKDVLWARMAKMSDRLSHGYFVVDHEVVWQVIKQELPELKPKVEEVYKNERKRN